MYDVKCYFFSRKRDPKAAKNGDSGPYWLVALLEIFERDFKDAIPPLEEKSPTATRL